MSSIRRRHGQTRRPTTATRGSSPRCSLITSNGSRTVSPQRSSGPDLRPSSRAHPPVADDKETVADLGEIALIARVADRVGFPGPGDVLTGDDAAVVTSP